MTGLYLCYQNRQLQKGNFTKNIYNRKSNDLELIAGILKISGSNIRVNVKKVTSKVLFSVATIDRKDIIRLTLLNIILAKLNISVLITQDSLKVSK